MLGMLGMLEVVEVAGGAPVLEFEGAATRCPGRLQRRVILEALACPHCGSWNLHVEVEDAGAGGGEGSCLDCGGRWSHDGDELFEGTPAGEEEPS